MKLKQLAESTNLELQIYQVLKKYGGSTKLEIVQNLHKEYKTRGRRGPSRFEVWDKIDQMAKRGNIDVLPIDHSNSLNYERRYALPED